MSMINPLLYHNGKTSFFNFHSADAAKGFAHDIVKRTHLTPPEGSLEALTEAEQQDLSQGLPPYNNPLKAPCATLPKPTESLRPPPPWG